MCRYDDGNRMNGEREAVVVAAAAATVTGGDDGTHFNSLPGGRLPPQPRASSGFSPGVTRVPPRVGCARLVLACARASVYGSTVADRGARAK